MSFIVVRGLRRRSSSNSARYSADQPRDDHGRFAGSGDGGPPPAEAPLPTWQRGLEGDTGYLYSPPGARGEADDYAKEAFDQTKLTEDQSDALAHYTAEDYEQINSYLRGQTSAPPSYTPGALATEDIPATVDELDAAVAKGSATEDTTVFRGMTAEPPTAPGTIFVDHGFVSTSLREPVAWEFTNDTGNVAEIHIPSGETAMSVSNAMDVHGGESEVLLPRDSAFQVTGRDVAGHVLMDYLGPQTGLVTQAARSENAADAAGNGARFVWDEGDLEVMDEKSLRYSDDQPRDDHGRFAPGDSNDSGGAATGQAQVTLAALSTGQAATVTAYHGTTAANAESIEKNGFVAGENGTWGPGIYLGGPTVADFAATSDTGVVLQVNANLDNPLVMTDGEAKAALADVTKAEVPAEIQGQGHDALVVQAEHSGERQMIVWDASKLDVVSSTPWEPRYSDDQPRDGHGRWTGDGGGDDSGGSSGGAATGDPFDSAFQKAAIERYTGLPTEQGGTGGGRDDLSTAEKVAIEDAVRWQGTSSPEPLYRGVATAEVPNVGDRINVPWASGTTELDQAAAYAENADGSHVVFEYPTGTVALDVSAQAGVPAEQERLFGGNFRVTDIGPAYEGEQDSPTLVKMELSDERWEPSPEYVAALQSRSAKRYSDDQPRDKDGKWASDGGSDGGSNGPESWQHESVQLGDSVDKAAVFAQEAFTQGDLSEAEDHAVSQYVEVTSLEINAALREGSALSGTEAETVRGLDSAIDASKTTQDVTVFRGVGVGDASIPTTEPGTTYTDHGFVSSSLREPTAALYGSTVAEIHVPEGTNALAVSNAYGGLGDVNSEVILPRGSAFQVTGTGPTGNVLIDYVGKAVPTGTATRSERAKASAKSRFVWVSGDVVVTTVEEKHEARYSDDQPRDDHGRWTGSGGDDADSGSGSGGSGAVADVVAGLEEGQHETVSADALQATVAAMADAPNPINLENLHVDGYGNGNLFDHSATDLPREAMPQIGNTPTAVQDFAGYLQQQGITAETTQVAPGDLHATQNQLDGREVAGIEEVIAKDPRGGFSQRTIVTANDGAVLDGHHFWAASAVYGETHTDFRINTLQVHTDINTLLTTANQYDVVAGIGHQVFGQVGPPPGARAEFAAEAPEDPPSDDRPWLYFDGQWLLIATDTADGIPKTLDVPDKAARPEKRYSEDQPRDDHGRFAGSGATDLSFQLEGEATDRNLAEEADAYASQVFTHPDLTGSQNAALLTYVVDGATVNDSLRDGVPLSQYLEPVSETTVADLDAAITKSEATADVTVFRGVDESFIPDKVGAKFTDPAYVSTSLRMPMAAAFMGEPSDGGQIAQINIPAGSHALAIANTPQADPLQQENEVVLPRDSQFQVAASAGDVLLLNYLGPQTQARTEAREEGSSDDAPADGGNRFVWRPGDIEVEDDEARYSEDQPRDDHGRFASTGGEGDGGDPTQSWQRDGSWNPDAPRTSTEKAETFAAEAIKQGDLTPAEQDAVATYQTHEYYAVNGFLRGGPDAPLDLDGGPDQPSTAQVVDTVHSLDGAISDSTAEKDLTVFRGVAGEDVIPTEVGAQFVDHGFVSTSLSERIATSFSGTTTSVDPSHLNEPWNTVAEIRVPEGANALAVSNAVPGTTSEAEVILPRDTKFEVASAATEQWRDPAADVTRSIEHVTLNYLGKGPAGPANSALSTRSADDSPESRFAWRTGDIELLGGAEARYSDDQPRDDHGRWSGDGGDDSSSPGSTDSGLASKVVEAAESGGGTIDPRTGAEPTEGFAVAVDAHTLTADATLYHVTDASNDAAISRDGLRPAAEIGTGGLEPEMPDTYDARGVFLATAPQAEVLAQQMRDNEVEPITYAATVPEGTTMLRDALMPESSVLVPGSIPASQLEAIPDEELTRRADGAEQGLEPATVDQLPLSTASSITPANEFFANGGEDGAQVTADWLRANQDLFDSNDAFHVGVWYDTAHQEVVLDPSEVFPADQRAEAIQAGIGRNQQAIYDLGAGEEIPTGGTGGRSEARTSDDGKAEEEDPRSHGRRTVGVRPRTRRQVGEGRSGQEARGELNLSLSRSAAPPPPDLREADTASNERCGTCHMHDPDTGQCWGYGNLPVSSDWVCDSYAAEPDGAS